MFEVTEKAQPLPTIVLSDSDSGAEAEIVPGRGGMATRFAVGATPVFYLDEATLLDPTKNVRGGAPFLFPTAGRLEDDTYIARREADARHGAGRFELKQHGFARNLPWRVEGRSAERAARVVLSLEANAETRARWPFEFRVELGYELAGRTLTITQRYHNRSGEPMPLHAGFHPYFQLAEGDKARARIETRATRAFDNVTKSEVPFTGFDLTQKEVDLHLVDHGSSASAIVRPDGTRIDVTASPDFTHWVVWTVAGKEFVCLEPWTAPGNALNTGDRLLWVEPAQSRDLWIAITLG